MDKVSLKNNNLQIKYIYTTASTLKIFHQKLEVD